MSDFLLEINDAGSAVRIEPVGTIDREGAQNLLDVVWSMQNHPAMALLEIRLDRVDGMTTDAWRLLAGSALPVEVMATGLAA